MYYWWRYPKRCENRDIIGIVAGLSIGVAAIIAFILIIRSTFTLEKEDRTRIIDLLVIGAIIYLTHMIMSSHSATCQQTTLFAGFLILLYGFIILIYKKFEEGYRESRKER